MLKRFRDSADDLLRMVGVWALLSSIVSATLTGVWAYALSLPSPVLAVLVLASSALVLNIALALKWFRRRAYESSSAQATEMRLFGATKHIQEIESATTSKHQRVSNLSYGKASPAIATQERAVNQLRKSPETVIAEVLETAALKELHRHLVLQPGGRDSLGRLVDTLLPACNGDPATAGTLLTLLIEGEYLHAVLPLSTRRFELSQKAVRRIATGR